VYCAQEQAQQDCEEELRASVNRLETFNTRQLPE
jgi:hypothetical protein